MNLEEFRKKRKELDEVARKSGKTLLTEMFKDLFEKCPDLQEVRWQQYTPCFNDGEACEFSVGEMGVLFTGEKTNEKDEEHDFHEDYLFPYQSNFPKQYKKFCEEVGKSTGELEQLFLMAFDDHVEVAVVKNEKGKIEFEVSEYNHD